MKENKKSIQKIEEYNWKTFMSVKQWRTFV